MGTGVAQLRSLSDELLIELVPWTGTLRRIDPTTQTCYASVYRFGMERIGRLLERLAIEGGSHGEWLAVFDR